MNYSILEVEMLGLSYLTLEMDLIDLYARKI